MSMEKIHDDVDIHRRLRMFGGTRLPMTNIPCANELDMPLQELLLARQWLDAMLALISPSSANRHGRMLRARLAEVDRELWIRLVDADCPWRQPNAG
jgi:hypothetical protein